MNEKQYTLLNHATIVSSLVLLDYEPSIVWWITWRILLFSFFQTCFPFIYVKISIHVKDDSSQPLDSGNKWKRPVKISRRFTISKITKYSFGPIKVECLNTPISEVCNTTTMKFSLKNIRKQKIPHNWNLTLDRKSFFIQN